MWRLAHTLSHHARRTTGAHITTLSAQGHLINRVAAPAALAHTLSGAGVSWRVPGVRGAPSASDVRVLEKKDAWWVKERANPLSNPEYIVDKHGNSYSPDVNWALQGMGISPETPTPTSRNRTTKQILSTSSQVDASQGLAVSSDRGSNKTSWRFVAVGSQNKHANFEYVDWFAKEAARTGTPYEAPVIEGFTNPYIPNALQPMAVDKFGSLLKRTRDAFVLAEDGIHIRDVAVGTSRHDSVLLRVITDSSEVDLYFKNIGVHVSKGTDPRFFRHDIELITSETVLPTLSSKRQAKYTLGEKTDTIIIQYDQRRVVAVGKPPLSALKDAVSYLAATSIVSRGGLSIPCHSAQAGNGNTVGIFTPATADVLAVADGVDNHVWSERGLSSFWAGRTIPNGKSTTGAVVEKDVVTIDQHPSANVFTAPRAFVFSSAGAPGEVTKVSGKDAHALFMEYAQSHGVALGQPRAQAADRFVEYLEDSSAVVYKVNGEGKNAADWQAIVDKVAA